MKTFLASVREDLTWKNLVNLLRFFNLMDVKTGTLSPPKVLVWIIVGGIAYSLSFLARSDMDLGVFATAISTLVGAFAVAVNLSYDRKIKATIQDNQP